MSNFIIGGYGFRRSGSVKLTTLEFVMPLEVDLVDLTALSVESVEDVVLAESVDDVTLDVEVAGTCKVQFSVRSLAPNGLGIRKVE